MIRFSTIKLGLFLFIYSILYSFLYVWGSFISFILLLFAYLGGWVEPWSRHSSFSLRCLANNTVMIRFSTIKLGLFLFIYSILYSFLYAWVSFISFYIFVARLPRGWVEPWSRHSSFSLSCHANNTLYLKIIRYKTPLPSYNIIQEKDNFYII